MTVLAYDIAGVKVYLGDFVVTVKRIDVVAVDVNAAYIGQEVFVIGVYIDDFVNLKVIVNGEMLAMLILDSDYGVFFFSGATGHKGQYQSQSRDNQGQTTGNSFHKNKDKGLNSIAKIAHLHLKNNPKKLKR